MLKSKTFVRYISSATLEATPKVKSTSSLKKPQFDFQSIVNNANNLIESAKLRKMSPLGVETIRDNYKLYNSTRYELSQLQHKRKELEVALRHQKTEVSSQTTSEEAKEKLKELKRKAKELTTSIAQYEDIIYSAANSVPNIISPDSFLPEPDTVEILNKQEDLPTMPKDHDHMTVAKLLGIVDMSAASRVSGSSWYYLIGDGALLEQALVNFALSKARKRGFIQVIPPSIVRQEMANACGFRPRDQNGEQQIYNIEGSDLCLTGTAEIPLAGLYSETNIDLDSTGVKKHVGVSRSYRAEAGARGRDTKGLYRVHEFTKVELFAWTDTKKRSISMLQEILDLQKEIISELGLTARVLNMSPDELGAPAYKKYDIEAWMPGRRDWGEVTSASNCLDFQSRRMHTKYRTSDKKLEFAQTLNGTAMAVPRVIVAILESFYEPDRKRVKIPSVLRKWMDEKEYIE